MGDCDWGRWLPERELEGSPNSDNLPSASCVSNDDERPIWLLFNRLVDCLVDLEVVVELKSRLLIAEAIVDVELFFSFLFPFFVLIFQKVPAKEPDVTGSREL